MKILLSIIAVVAVLLGVGYLVVMHTAWGQDFLMSRAVSAMVPGDGEPEDALRVFVCGSSGPLPTEGREQACLAVLTPQHFFIVDAGAGSNSNLGLEGLPMATLDGILLTHFHSDHIAAIPDMNLSSWAGGRPEPLKIYGPPGVTRVVSGLNEAYAFDRKYRSTHHGEDFLPEAVGMLQAREQVEDATLTFGDLTITSFTLDHGPIKPAVGYRFDYKGRSVVVTGDTIVTDTLRAVVADADLLLSDALSLPIITAMEAGARALGRDRAAHILFDIQDYHASVASLVELTRTTNVGMTALYHLVPGPRNALMENIFRREFEGNMVLTHDRMWFELPAHGEAIRVVD